MSNRSTFPLLERIDSPADLRKLPESQLEALATELREYLVQSVSQSAGHFAAGLGALEPSQSLPPMILGCTLSALGIQTVLMSF